MARIDVTMTDEFRAAVEAYQRDNDLRSLSQAIAQLAAVGLYIKTGQRPPEYAQAWGGDWRRDFEGNFEGIDVEKWLPVQGDHALVQDDPRARPTLVDDD